MQLSYPKWLEKENTTIVTVIFVPETGGSCFLGDNISNNCKERYNLPPSRKSPKKEVLSGATANTGYGPPNANVCLLYTSDAADECVNV